MKTSTAFGIEVGDRLDGMPIVALHLAIMLVCGLGLTFDLLEIALGSALSAVFSQPPHRIEPAQLSWVLSAVFVGAIVGAPVLGRWADRFGRRTMLSAMLLWLGVTSLGAAFSSDITALIVFRVLAGLSLGAYPPTVIAFLTDVLPPARRGMQIFCVVALSTLGPVGAIFLVRWLTPIQPLGIEAWRWAFIVGAVGALIVGLLFLLIPESPRWLAKMGHESRARVALSRFQRSRKVADADLARTSDARDMDSAASGLVSPHATRRAWRLIVGIFFLSPWATAAFPLLAGAILAQKGIKLSDALLYLGLSLFGPTIGSSLAAATLDRFERRTALVFTGAGMLVFGFVFVASSSPFWLVTSNLLFTTVGAVYIAGLNVYVAELFPTDMRATRAAGAWALNRLGAAVGSLLLLPLMRSAGPYAMFAVVATSLLLSIGLLALAPRGRARCAVD